MFSATRESPSVATKTHHRPKKQKNKKREREKERKKSLDELSSETLHGWLPTLKTTVVGVLGFGFRDPGGCDM